MFVDFEYSTSSSAAEDIANHFSEMMYDYNDTASEYMHRDYFPSEKDRKMFIATYLEAYSMLLLFPPIRRR